jgi:hypothetical protein
MSTPSLPPGYQEIQQNANSAGLPPGYQEVPARGSSTLQGPPNLNDVGQVAPYAGRALAASLPAVGGVVGSALTGGLDPIGAAAGGGLGSAISEELRNEFPKIFGELDRNPANFGTQIATDAAGQGLMEGLGKLASKATIPGILSAPIVRNIYAVKQGVAQASQKEAQSGLDELMNPQISAKTDNAQMRLKGTSTPTMPLSEAKATSDLISKGYNKTSNRFQPEKILEELDKTEGISDETKSTIKSILNEVKDEPVKDSVLNYSKGRFAIGLPAAALGIATGHSAITTGAAGAIYLGDKVITKLMSNPDTAKLVLQAIKTPGSAPEAPLVGKILANTVRGLMVPLEVKDR